MVKNSINVITTIGKRYFGRGTLLLKKYSPELLTGAGVIGVVTAGVLASKATLKLEEVIDAEKDSLESIELANKKSAEDESVEYSANDALHDKTVVYTRLVGGIAKLYWVPVTVGAASIACLLSAHGIMHKRNAALTAAYISLEQGFKEYRKRVQESIGIEKEDDIRYGVETKKKTRKVDGQEVVETTRKVVDPNGISIYARFFDEGCAQWSKTPEYNLIFLKAQQNYANNMLQSRGHVFLNEVYDMLGLQHSQAGAVCGWVLGDDGDNYIDFGIYDPKNQQAREFVNGNERSILLDFNVDGVIYNLI